MISDILGYTGEAPEEYVVTIENSTDYSGQRGLGSALINKGKGIGKGVGAVLSRISDGVGSAYHTLFKEAQTGVIKDDAKGAQRYHVVIKALIQEEISFNTEALWSPNAATSIIRRTSSQTLEALTGRTLLNKFVSRRQWDGTSPLDFTLNLRFESIEDNFREVVWPCVELQRMILPSSGNLEALGEWFLMPPGPNPFFIEAISNMQEGEIINVKIGRFINVKKVVLKSISLKFSPHFLVGGAPLAILATVNFSAFDIFTKESLEKDMYDINSSGNLSYRTSATSPGTGGGLPNLGGARVPGNGTA